MILLSFLTFLAHLVPLAFPSHFPLISLYLCPPYTHLLVLAHVSSCVYVCVRACVRACMHACVRVCVRACVLACVCALACGRGRGRCVAG